MLTGKNGILTQANNAKEETEKEEVKEKAKIDIMGVQAENNGEITKDQFREVLTRYFDNVPTEIPDDITNLTLKSKKEYGEDEIKISEIYNGRFKGVVYKTIADLKVGDRVYYKDKENNDIECVVLYDYTSEYGVQVVSDKFIRLENDSSEYQTSKEFYNNFLKILYDESQKYLNIDYASSARSLGSDPADPDWDIFENEAGYYTKEIALEKGEYIENFEEYYGTLKNPDENYITDLEQMKKIKKGFLKVKNYSWLASRELNVNADDNEESIYCTLCGFIPSDLQISRKDICGVTNDHNEGIGSYGMGTVGCLRPVFTLKSDLKITGGNGVDEPYRLVP